ncbi:MAG: pseudouridine synthase [Syntrophomonadaceae bacterium]
MRLAQYIAKSGLASRRKAEAMIIDGLVAVNGITVIKVGTNIDPGEDQVSVNGVIIKPGRRVYLLLNKPRGYLSSVGDHRGRPTVVDLVKEVSVRVYPVGRLDLDTEGLLILTNDGTFTNLMIHPRYHIPKTYQALVKGSVSNQELTGIRQGMRLEDGMTMPALARVLQAHSDRSLVEVVLYEGRKRQVKRMFKEIGHPVIALQRTGLGFLTLQGLAPGQYRCLRDEEVARLIAMTRGS